MNFQNSIRHFRSDNVHNSENADKCKASLLNVFNILILRVVVFRTALIRNKIFISQTNSSESLLSVVVNNVVEVAFHFIAHFFYIAVDVQVV